MNRTSIMVKFWSQVGPRELKSSVWPRARTHNLVTERSEAHGGVYPTCVGARVGGGSCGGQLLPWFTLASRGHCRLVGNT